MKGAGTKGSGAAAAQLEKFLAGRKASRLSGPDEAALRALLAATKTKLGDRAAALAQERVLRARLEAEREGAGKSGVQEKIAFVKMEYFLYAFADAHRLMRQLDRCGQAIRSQVAEAAALQADIDQLSAHPGAKTDLSRGGNSDLRAAQRSRAAAGAELQARASALQNQTAEARAQLRQKETELLAVLTELARCDLHAPSDHFDGDRLLKQGQLGHLGAAQEDKEFKVPLATLWRPADLTGFEALAETAQTPAARRYKRAIDGLKEQIGFEEKHAQQKREREEREMQEEVSRMGQSAKSGGSRLSQFDKSGTGRGLARDLSRGSFRSTGRSEGSQRSASPLKGASASRGWDDQIGASSRQYKKGTCKSCGAPQPDLSKKLCAKCELGRMLAPAVRGAATFAEKEEAKETGEQPQGQETEEERRARLLALLAPRTGPTPTTTSQHPEHWSFPKLTNPAFAREQTELERLGRKLRAQIEPGQGEVTGQGVSDDPFSHLRNKERADELIGQAVERFCAPLGERAALNQEACRAVTLSALTRMVGKVQREGALLTQKDAEAFAGPQKDEEGNPIVSDIELGFETSFRIYADQQGQIAKTQLKNFVKSALDL